VPPTIIVVSFWVNVSDGTSLNSTLIPGLWSSNALNTFTKTWWSSGDEDQCAAISDTPAALVGAVAAGAVVGWAAGAVVGAASCAALVGSIVGGAVDPHAVTRGIVAANDSYFNTVRRSSKHPNTRS